MGFYDGLKTTAAALLAQFGEPATLRIKTGDTFDPDTLTNVATYADEAVSVYVGNYDGMSNIDGTPINTSDRKLIVQGVSVEPDTDSLVVVGATTYRIANVKPVGGQGVGVIYIMQGQAQ